MIWKKLFSFLVVCTGNLLAAASYTMANPMYPSEVSLNFKTKVLDFKNRIKRVFHSSLVYIFVA